MIGEDRRPLDESHGRAPGCIGTWALVLAGGRGRRLQHVTQALGEPSEKQFCRLGGRRTLLQRTVDRLAPVVDGITVVVMREREDVARAQLAERDVCLVDQPGDRGTGIGTLVGLIDVERHAPNPVVILSPADHAFADETAVTETLAEAVELAHSEDAIVLVGASPDAPRSDYGWIVPDGAPDSSRVRRFAEKPSEDVARGLMRQGAVFNTMMLAAPLGRLMGLFEDACLPAVEAIRHGEVVRDHARFATLESVDFSGDILERARGLLLHRLPERAGWTDLGDERRLLGWLRAQGAEGTAERVRVASQRRPQLAKAKARRAPDLRASSI